MKNKNKMEITQQILQREIYKMEMKKSLKKKGNLKKLDSFSL
jgi:hypothetical protein